MSKKKISFNGLVYSTDPSFKPETPEEEIETLAIAQQKLQVKLDTKHRAGKVVTLVNGFIGQSADLEALGKKIKTTCGTGGAVKDGMIIIQGDYKQKITTLLHQLGYSVK